MDKGNLPTLFDAHAVEMEVGNEHEFLLNHEGACYAGRHLLIDVWEGENLSDVDVIDSALRRGAEAAGATLLHVHLHEFSENCGVSGVAILAESHISIHTWPETAFAAVDIFLCGHCDAYQALPILRDIFRPNTVQVSEHKRGLVT